MSLWNNTDANTGAPIFAPMQVQLAPTQENVNNLYGNNTVDVIVTGQTVGLFGVDTDETAAVGASASHAGWILRTTGTGGRAGRVTQETLVAMGSMGADDANASDDATYADALLTINTQPANQSIIAGGGNTATFTVVASSAPDSATETYVWEVNTGAAWEAIADETPANTSYTGDTTASLVVTPTTTEANGMLYRVTVSATGAVDVVSANATLTVA